MTSQLNVDTIVDKAGSGGTNVKVANTSTYVTDSGGATQNTVQSMVKSWLSANFSSQAYNDSFNQSSLSDQAAGSFRFTVTNNFANANYALGTEAAHVAANGTNTQSQEQSFARTTSQYQAYVSNDGSSVTAADTTKYDALLAGDLA